MAWGWGGGVHTGLVGVTINTADGRDFDAFEKLKVNKCVFCLCFIFYEKLSEEAISPCFHGPGLTIKSY